MKRRSLALLVLSLAASSAQAAIAPELPLEQEARRAELIVRGSLGAPQTVTEGAVTWRVYPLELTETVAGDVNRLPQQDGKPALYVWSEAGDLPDWRTGQDAFFLLYTARLDSPLVGYNQGYYPVQNGTVTLPESDRRAVTGVTTTPPTSAAPLLPVAQPAVAETVAVPAPQADPTGPTPEPTPAPPAGTPAPADALPTPADPAPDAPPVTRPTIPELPGLPSAATATEPATTPPAAAPAASPVPPQAVQAGTLSVDDFRALLLRARSTSGGQR